MGIRRHGRKAILLVIAGGLGLTAPGTTAALATTAPFTTALATAAPASTTPLAAAPAFTAVLTTAPLTASATAPDDDIRFAPVWYTPADLAAFAEIRRRQETAWAHGDAKGYASIYTPDADLVNILGEHLHSRQTITTKLQQYFNTQLKNTRLLEMDERIRFVSPTMAIIVRKSCVLYNKETACRPDTLSINTNVAVKNSGLWQIASFQNTLIRPHR
ncbi:hypothetical protein GCM10009677_32510 [Sphaerisporangium rubeum]|uniref:Uncharacterized protein (TIGR02246 family) n=1 Tax=Sphaerisporangium rubeum TaxID=321317 RepID=A0A7X0IC77_9ACTN|nr:SgcJ/EcaC family oxidoreductase [Sphaerisporangium rubeum]MBB6472544.1 uncharacterized protein (TIGR02246 family) [Sphaerisporangium rubeum]